MSLPFGLSDLPDHGLVLMADAAHELDPTSVLSKWLDDEMARRVALAHAAKAEHAAPTELEPHDVRLARLQAIRDELAVGDDQ